jgi:hypothetical protein
MPRNWERKRAIDNGAVSQTGILDGEKPIPQRMRRGYNLVRALLFCGLIALAAHISQAAAWHIETVDQGGAGRFTSLKVDKEGNAHLAYVVEDGKDTLKYAFWDHALKRWFTMKVAEGASFSSLTLDSKQRPRISWADAGTALGCKLRYAYWDGTAWKAQAIPLPSETVAYYTSLTLDPNDNPSISFYEYDGPKGTDYRVRMRVVTWNGQFWQVSTADGSNQSGKFNALAADAQGHLHLAYANVNAGTAGLRYGVWDGNAWHIEVVEGLPISRSYFGQAVCLVLNKNGDPRVSYMNNSEPSVRYAARENGHWVIEVVDWLAKVGYPDRNSIALDEEGRPYLGYYDAGLGSVKLAHKEGSNWIAETVDTGGDGYTSSVQVGDGMVWISYTDEGNAGIKVARAALSDVRRDGPSAGVKEKETAPQRHQP